jgi:hypothetical protein
MIRVSLWFGCRTIGMDRILHLVSSERQYFFHAVRSREGVATALIPSQMGRPNLEGAATVLMRYPLCASRSSATPM